MIEKCRLARCRVAESLRRNRRSASSQVMITEATTVTAPPGTILLGAYAARSCPVKTQNAFNPTVTIEDADAGASVEANDGLAELFDGGAQFKAAVLDQLIDSCRGRVVDLRPLSASTSRGADRGLRPGHDSGADVIIEGLPAC